MDPEFVNLTPENLADEHLSCIIRVRIPIPASRRSANGSRIGCAKAMCSERCR